MRVIGERQAFLWGYGRLFSYENDMTAKNLTVDGINAHLGQSVYGSNSGIPDNAAFWMEGVRPGKILWSRDSRKETLT